MSGFTEAEERSGAEADSWLGLGRSVAPVPDPLRAVSGDGAVIDELAAVTAELSKMRTGSGTSPVPSEAELIPMPDLGKPDTDSQDIKPLTGAGLGGVRPPEPPQSNVPISEGVVAEDSDEIVT
ncbi:hypothetical protein TeGR_g12842, partial [Tetraparma gracilis]